MVISLFVRRLFGACAAVAGAQLAMLLNIPLPWLLGPLFVIAALRLNAAPVACANSLRSAGQWAIGTSLGLYFTPYILELVIEHWDVVLIGIFIPLLLSSFGTWVHWRIGKSSLKTAWFSSAIGGSGEMSQLAERYGGRVDLVASAHSLRILAVVIIIPFGYQYFGLSGIDNTHLYKANVDLPNLALLAVFTVLAGILSQRQGLPNAWVLGPLLISTLMTLIGFANTTMPPEFINIGQLLIGWSLGDRYRPAFFKAAPRFLFATLIFTLGSLAIVMVIGVVISTRSDLPLPTIWLGLAPGGLAEMAITAKVLMLGVPMVTALQVTRMVFVVMVTGWLYNHIIEPIEKKLPAQPD
uniref:AbrB family transcriptional regulator n=1 Tax=Orrella sp. TaxID=1921583 RepID=UPI00404826F5